MIVTHVRRAIFPEGCCPGIVMLGSGSCPGLPAKLHRSHGLDALGAHLVSLCTPLTSQAEANRAGRHAAGQGLLRAPRPGQGPWKPVSCRCEVASAWRRGISSVAGCHSCAVSHTGRALRQPRCLLTRSDAYVCRNVPRLSDNAAPVTLSGFATQVLMECGGAEYW